MPCFDTKRMPVKQIRMADYFKKTSSNNKTDTLSARDISKFSTADERASNLDLDENNNQNQLQSIEAEQKWRDELDAKLEQDILDNVDVNFIFNKGLGLTQGLID